MIAHDWRHNVHTVWWDEDAFGSQHAAVSLLDQSLLPQEVVYLHLDDEQQVADAISSLKVRGAPAIGVTAAFGMALALHRLYREQGASLSLVDAQAHLQTTALLLRRTRPTAVNLFWAIDRMLSRAEQAIAQECSLPQLVARLCSEAQSIADEDVAACSRMGTYGAALIEDGDVLLTHCNAGALATAGMGTALSPIYVAHQTGKHVHVFVDETRPVLQGARLTAWELQQEGVPFTLITDNMAGHFMRKGAIKAVFVGADRIAANGDVANKIGTYSVAVLAHAHSLPFYVVAPCSTIDLSLPSGDLIPIEERRSEEVTMIGAVRIAPPNVSVANPAFDVTPHHYVTAIITERGVARAPFAEQLRQLCGQVESIGKVHG
jgi:methylthioribose-1-phosphate isomerase